MEERRWGPQYCSVDGHRLAFVRAGAGEPVVLVHGITTSSFIWDDVLPILSERYDTIAVDLLGCGSSDRPVPADYSIDAHSTRLLGLINALGLDRCHLVGHDIGGGVAQIFSVRHQEMVSSLTLVNTVGYDYWPVQPIVAMRTPVLRQIAMATLDLGMLGLIIRKGVHFKERITPDVLERFRREISAPGARRAFLALVRSLNNSQLMAIAGELQNLAMPVLIIRGERDPYLSPEIARRLHKEISGSRLVRIATGGHFVQLDEPRLVAKTIMENVGVRRVA